MNKAIFVMSSGRCATQYLAHVMQGLRDDVVVEHEPIGPNYVPRQVFRSTDFDRVVDLHPEVAQKFSEIEEHLASGRRYIDTGWPTFAWLPYLSRRFDGRFEFTHLVRNPLETAASLLTHNFFLGRDDPYARQAIIVGGPHTGYPQLADEWEGFSPLEKCLFHWLEVNTFLLEGHHLRGFRGMVRFEDLFSEDASLLNELVSDLMGQAVALGETEIYDKHQLGLGTDLVLSHGGLMNSVLDVSERLGYTRAELRQEMTDMGSLSKRYRTTRA